MVKQKTCKIQEEKVCELIEELPNEPRLDIKKIKSDKEVFRSKTMIL